MRPNLPASLSVCALLAVPCALAQPPAPPATPPAPPKGTFTARLSDNTLDLRDGPAGEPILLARGAAMVRGTGEGVTYALKMKEFPAGVDLVFKFMNTSAKAQPIGSITVGTFTLGRSVTYYDLRDTCAPVAVDSNTFLPHSATYPGDLYSPLWVLENEQYSVGISLLYPVMEYKHDARLTLTSPAPDRPDAEGGRGWVTTFQFNDSGAPTGLNGTPPKMQYPAMIPPGEVQTYTISIRVNPKRDGWIRTLVPYRDFFRGTYGGVRYVRRADPVQAIVMAEESKITDANPLGCTEPFRPDVHGWTRLSRYLRSETGDFNRTLLYNPAGVYRTHRENNPPFQMASTWNAGPPMATATDRYDGLPAVTTAGKDLGLWWGNSCRVSSAWDPAETAALDPAKPEHARLALAELDAGVKAGATTVVLGNFRHETTPLWVLHAWLTELAARYPEVRFVTDPSACDVLHGLAPTFVKGWNDTTTAKREADLYTIKNPNTLADFLLPGHETWAGFTYDNPKQAMKVVVDPARVKADMEKYAALGYVPCFFWTGKLEGTLAAAPTWFTSVPADLQISDAPQPLGPGTALDQSAAAKPPAQAAQAKTEPVGPKGPAIPRSGSKVTVHPAPGTVKSAPNEGEVRPDRSAVTEALRRAGATSAKAAEKSAKSVPTKVTPSQPDPKKPDQPK